MGKDPGKEEFIMTTINNNLTREVLKPMVQKVDFNPAEHGFTDVDHVAKRFNGVFSAIANSNATIAKLTSTHQGDALVNAVKTQTLNAINKKAIATLRAELEEQVRETHGEVMDTNGNPLYAGILAVPEGHKEPNTVLTYGYAVLAEVLASMATVELTDEKEIRSLAKGSLQSVKGMREILEYYNNHFVAGLLTDNYELGVGARYQEFTVDEGLRHQKVLYEFIKTNGIEDNVKAYLQSTLTAKQETVATTQKEDEEMVTITKEKYEAMQQQLEVQANQLANNEKAFKQLMAQLDEQKAVIEKYDAALTKAEKANADLVKHIKELQTTNNEKVETTMTNEFKLNVDAMKEITARATDENKVTNKADIAKTEVSSVMKARIHTVSAGKSINNKVRENAPKAIVATANATHKGIDVVADAAHKTTNFVANTTHAAVQHSVNAVDYMLDAIAPTVDATVESAFKQIDAQKKEGAIVTIGGFEFQIVEGKYVAL